MQLAMISQAVAMFAVTNIDDMLLLAIFFGTARGKRSNPVSVVVGQYVGFIAILAVSVLGAFGASLLPTSAIPYLGLLPLILGLRAAWLALRQRQAATPPDEPSGTDSGVRCRDVAIVTFANGGDNIGVYVPVFAVAGIGGIVGYTTVFLLCIAVWCAVSWYLASRLAAARVMVSWGHVLLPLALIAIGVTILIERGAFGL